MDRTAGIMKRPGLGEGRQQSDSQTKNTARRGAGGQETEHDVQDKNATLDTLDTRRREI